jgi:hypothetical protein
MAFHIIQHHQSAHRIVMAKPPPRKVCPKGVKLSVAKGGSGRGSPDHGKVGQRKATADDCGGNRVAAAPVGKRTSVRVKAPAGKVKGGNGKD